jgi:beta-lactam-binding protein with PASTA domain
MTFDRFVKSPLFRLFTLPSNSDFLPRCFVFDVHETVQVVIRIVKITTLFFGVVLIAGASAYFTLTLLIKSSDTVVVPDLISKDVVYVLEILSDLGLNTKIKGSKYRSDIPKNHVIFQEPDPGMEIKKGRDVRIIISKGAKTILPPNVTGLSIQQARIILEENDLKEGKFSITYSDTHKKDEIIAQYPSPGTMISRGEAMDLLVSRGRRPKSYKMPDLNFLSLDDAVRLIERSNLTLGEITSSIHRNKPINVITGQEPLAGYHVMEGRVVHLEINRKPGPSAYAILEASRGVSLFRFRLENGFLKKHIRVQMNIFGTSFKIFDEFVKPGKEIWLFIPNGNEATVLLYEDGELIKTQRFAPWNVVETLT